MIRDEQTADIDKDLVIMALRAQCERLAFECESLRARLSRPLLELCDEDDEDVDQDAPTIRILQAAEPHDAA